jgi:RHS repeat-associated protein
MKTRGPVGFVFFLLCFLFARSGLALDKAGFVGAAETCVDKTQLTFNTPFSKTWTIKNTGTTTWTSGYYFRYVSTNFNGKLSLNQSDIHLRYSVAPGGQYTVTIPMKAPASATNNACSVSSPAVFQGNGECEQWQFHNASNAVIKVENSTTIWAFINVFPTLNSKPANCSITSSPPSGSCSLVSPSPSGVGGQPLNALLDWSCTDPDNDIVDNYFEIDDNSDFSSILCGGFRGLNSSYQMPGGCGNSLSAGKTYYWRAYAKDSYGQVNATKPTWSFSTVAANSPPTCSLSLPSSGAVNQPLNVTLSWSCSDPDPGGTIKKYCLTLDDTSNLSSPLYNSCWGNGQVVTSFQPSTNGIPLANSTTYYWRVMAYDNLDAPSAWTATRSFTTAANNPPTCSLSSPANGAASQPLNVTLSWSCSDPDPGGTLKKYCLTLDDTSNFSSPLYNSCWPDGQMVTSFQPSTNGVPLGNSTTYYWRVMAYDNVNAPGAWSASRSFTTAASNLCPDQSPKDAINDPCNHDEDGDGVLDVNDACPFIPNDNVNDPCNPNDNGNIVFTGGAIDVTVPQGAIHQSQKFTLVNNGTSPLNYTLTTSPVASWLTISRNGGSTNALSGAHVLNAGQKDVLVVSLNTRNLQPGSVATTTIQLVSTDPSQGNASIPVTVHVQQAPYCPTAAACKTMATQTLGNRSPKVQNVSDPVNTATGNYAYHQLDLALPSRGLPLTFERTYNSEDKYLGPLGVGWTHTYNIFATEWGDGSVQIKWGDGHSEVYVPNGAGGYTTPAGIFSRLTKNANGSFSLLTKAHLEFDFATSGFLAVVTDRQGNSLTLSYDSQSRLSQVASSAGRTLTMAYGAADPFKLSSVTDSAGRSVQFQYTQDDLTGSTDALGGHWVYQVDANHQLIQVTDPLLAVQVHNTYDGFSRVVSQQDGKGKVTQLQYETPSAGHVTVIDPLNHSIAQVYDSQLRIAQSGDPAGHFIQYQYDANDLRTGLVDRNGKPLAAAYDARGNIVSLTDPLGAVIQFTYDPNTDDLLTITEPGGHLRSFAYDNAGNLVHVSETAGGQLIERFYTYNAWGQVLTAKDPNAHTTTFAYDGKGNLVTITDAGGGVTHLAYDNAGRVISTIDPLGQTTSFQYNAADHLTTITDPDGLSTQYHYDAAQNLTATIDRGGHQTTYLWDENGFLVSIQDNLGNTTLVARDALNRETQITDAENRVLHLQYDAAGNLAQITDPSGRVVQLGYDPEGNLISRLDAAGKTWSYGYDALGRLIQATDPLGQVSSYAYDPVTGTLDHATDAAGHQTQYHYDAAHRLTSMVDPLGQATSFAYDPASNLVALMNAAGHSTTFTYDAMGRRTAKTDALGAQEHATYDLLGRLTQRTDQRGKATHIAYDSLSRVASLSYADGKSVAFTYDATGHRLTRTDEIGASSYAYDAIGRLTSFHDPYGFQIGYQYDKTGLPTQVTYPGGHAVHYSYDAAKRMTQVTDWLNQATTYQYDAGGRLSQVVSPNGYKTAYGYDSASRLVHLSNTKADQTLLSSYDFTLDAIGRRTQVARVEPLKPWITPESVPAAYDAENELLSAGGASSAYDANGNLLSAANPAGATDYHFNDEDRLASISSAQGVVSFAYDGDGNRLSKSANGQTTKLIVDPSRPLPDVVAETDGGGAVQKYYVYGLGLVSQISADGSQVRYYHYDPLGSTIALSDPSGQVTDQYVYDEFGGLNRKVGATPNPFQYVGQLGVQNDGTGLYAMRARYYDPRSGRFISRDPIGFTGGMNLYGYAGNDPISSIDPSGLFSLSSAADWVWNGVNKINEKVIGPIGAAITTNEVAAGLAVYRKGITIKPSWFPFDIDVAAVTNVAGNLREMVVAGGGPVTKLLGKLGKVSEIGLAIDVGLTTAGELGSQYHNEMDIYSSREIPEDIKPYAVATEASLTALRIPAKMAASTVGAMDQVLEWTKWVNPVYYADLALSGGRNFDSSTAGMHDLMKKANNGIDGWTAINLRNSVGCRHHFAPISARDLC